MFAKKGGLFNSLFFIFIFFSLVPCLILLISSQSRSRFFAKAENTTQKIISSKDGKIEILSEEQDNLFFNIQTISFQAKTITKENKIYKLLNLEKGGYDDRETGKPALPFWSAMINVSANSSCRSEIKEPVFEDLVNYEEIYPAQPPQPETGKDEAEPRFAKDENFYSQDLLYPKEIVSLGDEVILRGSALRTIYFYPFQYNPAEKVLRHYKSFKVQIICSGGRLLRQPESSRDFFEPLKQRVINNSLIESSKVFNLQVGNTALEGADLIIITPLDFVLPANTLALWRNQKGIKTVVKTTAETGNTAESITNFIKNAYQTWSPSPAFVLLLGDAEFIPPSYRTAHPYEGNRLIGTDLYYAAVDGTDYFPDLAVGRISVDTLAQAQDRIDKIINYEKNPPTESSFYSSQGIAAYFQDGEGGIYDGYEDRPFIRTSEQIRDFFLGKNFNPARVYYTLSNVNPTNYNNGPYGSGESLPAELLRASGFLWNGDKTQISSLVNSGIFWLNHRDHGNILGWIYPNYNTGDVNSLTNGGQLPLISSFNCMSGWFDTETDDPNFGTDPNQICFSESWQRNANGGAVGIVSFSRTSFSGHNDALNKGFIDAIWPDFLNYSGSSAPIYLLGLDLNYAKIYYSTVYAESLTRKMGFEELHFFGDPATEIWTGVPQNITLTVPSSIQAGDKSLIVSVSENGALVTVVQNNSLLGSSFSQNKSATVGLNPAAQEGQLMVTATKHDFRPNIANVNAIKATAVDFVGCWPYKYIDGNVIVNWETASEVDNLGFNVYYSQTLDIAKANRINTNLIPAKSLGSVAGAEYQYKDLAKPTLGYYWIEAISTTGLLEKFGAYSLQSAPAAPTGLTVKVATTSNLLLTWKGLATKDYDVQIATCNSSGKIISSQIFNVIGNQFSRKPGLTISKYKFRVREKYGNWSVYKSFKVSK